MNDAIAHRTIWLQPAAPPQPAAGEPCNGCGVCCAAEPCPAGMLASFSRSGPCRLLRWDDSASRYRCGLMGAEGAAPGWRRRLAARWIAAGQGCDCTLQS
jgi:hypothetical protein